MTLVTLAGYAAVTATALMVLVVLYVVYTTTEFDFDQPAGERSFEQESLLEESAAGGVEADDEPGHDGEPALGDGAAEETGGDGGTDEPRADPA